MLLKMGGSSMRHMRVEFWWMSGILNSEENILGEGQGEKECGEKADTESA